MPTRGEAICAYEDHREFDWSTEDGHWWVCGKCHPPPGAPASRLADRQEGFMVARDRFVTLVRPDPSEPRRRLPHPTSSSDGEVVYVKLRRPRSRAEAEMFSRELGRAFDKLGVARGDEFVVMKRLPPTAAPLDVVEGTAAGQSRNGDPRTSKAAAEMVLPRSGTQRRKVIDALMERRDGLISDELAAITGIDYRSVSPRIGELKHLGWVKATSRTRKSTKNADSEVLVLTDGALGRLGVEPQEPTELLPEGPQSAIHL